MWGSIHNLYKKYDRIADLKYRLFFFIQDRLYALLKFQESHFFEKKKKKKKKIYIYIYIYIYIDRYIYIQLDLSIEIVLSFRNFSLVLIVGLFIVQVVFLSTTLYHRKSRLGPIMNSKSKMNLKKNQN